MATGKVSDPNPNAKVSQAGGSPVKDDFIMDCDIKELYYGKL